MTNMNYDTVSEREGEVRREDGVSPSPKEERR
jgi:hypothetical protein